MAERSVVVRLRAEIADFKRQMDAATKVTKATGDESEKTGKKADTALGQLVQSAVKNEQAWTRTGVALLGFGTALASGIGVAVAKFADFDQAMSEVRASTHETSANMDLLREAALQAGADTQYSATEAANAIDEMAKAGVETADILGGGLAGAMSLAAAGGLDVAEAAETAATAMSQFQLAGEDLPHVADLLAAGAGKAQGSVSDMGMALKQAGLVANQTGLSIEETTGGLAAFAKAGLIGSDSGTAFKAMLQRLTPQSTEAADLMSDLGISAYDAQGQFIGLAEFAGNLRGALADLTPEQRNSAMATIFGSDAVRAAAVLYDQGEAGVRKWIQAVDDQGYAAVTAALKMDNLKGDLELLSGSFETALIQTGSAGNEVLRDMVQQLTDVVDAYGRLPEPVQRAVFQFGALAGGAALVGGAVLTTVPKVIELRRSVSELADASPRAAKGLRAVGKAAGALAVLAVAGTAVSAFTDETNKSVLSLAESTKFLASSSSDLADINAQFAELSTQFGGGAGFDSLEDGLRNLADPGLMDRLNDVSASALALIGLPYENGRPERQALIEQLGSMGDGLAQLAQNGQADLAAERFDLFAAAARRAGMSQEDLLDLMPAYRDALADAAAQQEMATGGTDRLATGIGGVQMAADDAEDSLDQLSKALDALLADQFDVEVATDQFEQALIDLAGAAKENGTALEGNSQEAIRNREQMRAAVTDAAGLVEAYARTGKSAEEVAAFTAQLRQRLYDQAVQAGYSGTAAARYASALDQIPGVYEATIRDNTSQAMDRLNAYLRRLNDIDGSTATTYIRQVERLVRTGPRTAQADGGILTFADGGTMPAIGAQQPQIQPNHGPGGIMWAETGAGPWEAFISGHPAKHERSVRIWEETGERLGLRFQRFDSGGYYGPAAAPSSHSRGPDVVSLSNTDIWKLADAVSRVQLSLNGRAIAENTQSRQDFMMRAGG